MFLRGPRELLICNRSDLLPICAGCHRDYERHSDEFKIGLGKEYDVPLLSKAEIQFHQELADNPTVSRNPKPATFGPRLASRVSNPERFKIKWREHFLEKAQPNHLPTYWEPDLERYDSTISYCLVPAADDATILNGLLQHAT